MNLQFANDIIRLVDISQLVDISHNLHMPDVLGQSHEKRLRPGVSLNSSQ